jgi:hypothetical protein
MYLILNHVGISRPPYAEALREKDCQWKLKIGKVVREELAKVVL